MPRNKTKYYFEVQKKPNSITKKDCNFLIGRVYFIGNGDFQNMLLYQPLNKRLKIKNATGGLQYVNRWLLKWAHDNSKLALVKGAEEPIIRHFEYKLTLEFNDSALVVQSNNYLTKLVNAYIVYGLDN